MKFSTAKHVYLFFLIYLANSCYLYAQPENESVRIIADEVSEEEIIKRDPSSVEIIDVNESFKNVESLGEILSTKAGVQIKRYGSIGSNSTISIRGSDSSQVMIYLDGIPLNDAKFGEINLENLPVDNLERIEIYRSFAPARFGTGGIGGVVNLVSKKTGTHETNSTSFSYGSYNTSKIILSRSQRIEKFDYLIFFNRTASDGNFIFLDDNGTPVLNTDDDKLLERENNQQRVSILIDY